MENNFLFLYLKTGGGHLAPARSIANYLNTKHKGTAKTHLADGFTQVNPVIKYLVEDGYRKSQAQAVWVFEALYALNKIRPIAKLTTRILTWFVTPFLEKLILEQQPKKIIIFHFFLIRAVIQIVARHQLDTKIITVVTDPFTAHPIWFLEKETRMIVFSERVQNQCIKNGFDPKHVKVFPFILDEKFTKPLPEVLSRSVKQYLGFTPEKRLVLILGGGDGIPKGKKLLKNFLRDNPEAEVAIVCGKNKTLYKKAMHVKIKHQFSNLKVYGYVEFVYELINISDVVITKCGASTFMEILHSGKIPVISNYIWEQEKGNMEFVRDNDLGIYENDLSILPKKTAHLLQNQDLYNFYKENIRKTELKNGTPMVSEFLLQP